MQSPWQANEGHTRCVPGLISTKYRLPQSEHFLSLAFPWARYLNPLEMLLADLQYGHLDGLPFPIGFTSG